MPERIRVLLVDDHALVREGLRLILHKEPDIEVVGEAGSGEAALEIVPHLHPDVVVMDIAMPGMDGIEATRRLKEIAPDSRTLILTMHAEDRYLGPLVEAGAFGYVLKDSSHTDLVNALHVVARGEVFLYPGAVALLMRQYVDRLRASEQHGSYARLSEREREILVMVAEGYTSAEIGERLFLSPKTVDTYRERIANKLGFHRRADFVHYALCLGLLRTGD